MSLQRVFMSASILPAKRTFSTMSSSTGLPILQSIVDTSLSGVFPEAATPETLPIGTHNGHFHCDEALACGMLKLLPEFKTRPILRTRNQELLDKCHIVVDVGGTFDHDKKRYDHHQRSFEETFDSDEHTKTKLSSAGLVYKYYGKDIIAEIAQDAGVQLDTSMVDKFFLKVYGSFVEHVDAIDNGVSPFKDDFSVPTHLSARVGSLNPAWNEESTVEDEMNSFKQAMLVATGEFVSNVQRLCTVWLPARKLVEVAVADRLNVHPSGEVLKFEGSCPWKGHLAEIEKEQNLGSAIKYVLYPDSSNNWRIQCVSVEPSSFENRKSLPKRLMGLRDDELSQASGIEGCIFIHANGFIGGAKTFDSVMKLADLALKEEA